MEHDLPLSFPLSIRPALTIFLTPPRAGSKSLANASPKSTPRKECNTLEARSHPWSAPELNIGKHESTREEVESWDIQNPGRRALTPGTNGSLKTRAQPSNSWEASAYPISPIGPVTMNSIKGLKTELRRPDRTDKERNSLREKS